MRFYQYLINEARESRDRIFRNEAKRIIEKLKDYFSGMTPEKINEKHRVSESKWLVDFSKIEPEYDLYFLILDFYDGEFATGNYKGTPLIQLPIVSQDDLSTIELNLDMMQRNIMHEIIHFFDKLRGGLKGKSVDFKTIEDYYNNPAEFNAFYQEAVNDIKEFMEKLKSKEGGKKMLKQLNLNTVHGFIDYVKRMKFKEDFIKNLNKKYMRKLDKRLADLYQELQKEGLIPKG